MDANMDAGACESPAPPSPPQELITRIRDALGNKSSQDRGQEKLEAAIMWTFLWHKTTPGLLRVLLGVKAAGSATQYARKGIVQLVQTAQVRGGTAVMLTEDGVAMAEEMFPELSGRYDTRWTSVPPRLLIHDLVAQFCVLEVMGKYPVIRYLPEHAAGRADTAGDKRFDCRIWLEGAHLPTALEFERTSKRPGVELDRTLFAVASALERNEIAGVLYYFANPRLADIYRETLESPLPVWKKDQSAGKWIATEERWQVPQRIQQRFKWLVRTGILRRFIR
jgi:hypothetical protein